MTDPKPGPPRRLDTGPITPLRPEADDGDGAAVWRPAPPRDDESIRWECSDGRFITVGLGSGAATCTVLVRHSSGRSESVESYEAALILARRWQAL